jgi:hypothetical protein
MAIEVIFVRLLMDRLDAPGAVCTENLIRVDRMAESPKLTQ